MTDKKNSPDPLPKDNQEGPSVLPAIIAEQVTLARDDKPILQNLSFQIPQGSLTALVGPNGGGKSTLMEALVAHEKPMAGFVQMTHQLSASYLPQRCQMNRSFPLSVKDVVATGLWGKIGLLSPFLRKQRQAVKEALRVVGMPAFALAPISDLSGGQFQRVLFARLLVQGGDILLLDEPFTAIDSATTDMLLEVVQAWHKQGKTILVTLHDIDLVRKFFPYTLLLARNFFRWGKTDHVLTDENLALAHAETQKWEQCPC